jgi:tetratricopeptide (TPR) repeat protein
VTDDQEGSVTLPVVHIGVLLMHWRAERATVLLLLAVVSAGGLGEGCRNDRTASDAGRPASPVAQDGQSQSPYYYGLIEEYRAILAEDPNNLAANIALANAYYDAGQWKDAISFYEQALELNPSNADLITDMGTCYRNLGMPDHAIRTYERALAIEPSHQNALFNLGVVYGYDKKNYRKAIALWERLLHLAPKHPHASEIRASLAGLRTRLKEGSR